MATERSGCAASTLGCDKDQGLESYLASIYACAPAVELDGVLGLGAVVDGRVKVVDEDVDVGVRVLHLERRPLRVHVVGADRNTADRVYASRQSKGCVNTTRA